MTEILLRARGIDVWYPGSSEPAVEGADLNVGPRDAIGIVGESGSGKTTLGRVLVGAIAPTSGQVEVEGRSWRTIRRKDPLRRNVQMIFQDPYGALNPMLTAHQTVMEVLRVTGGMPRSRASARATEILCEVGLGDEVARRRPPSLSGGQCQRVGIARALACDPRVLVADEPTSSLDVSVQAQILNLLVDLREQRGLSLVLISHDLAVVDYVTQDALVMYRGRIVERGPTHSLLVCPRHPYTRALVDSIPGNEGKAKFARNHVDRSRGCVFAPRCPHVQDDCLVDQPPLEKVGAHDVACLHPVRVTEAASQQGLAVASRSPA